MSEQVDRPRRNRVGLAMQIIFATLCTMIGIASCIFWLRARDFLDSAVWVFDRRLGETEFECRRLIFSSSDRGFGIEYFRSRVGPLNATESNYMYQ